MSHSEEELAAMQRSFDKIASIVFGGLRGAAEAGDETAHMMLDACRLRKPHSGADDQEESAVGGGTAADTPDTSSAKTASQSSPWQPMQDDDHEERAWLDKA